MAMNKHGISFKVAEFDKLGISSSHKDMDIDMVLGGLYVKCGQREPIMGVCYRSPIGYRVRVPG